MISIVVPVYNVEAYLERCVNSLLDQDTIGCCEVILVDDGSTDRSGRMCDEYAAKHKEIRVIHQRNQGPSAARNTGMDAATKEYVLFVDSDDMIEKNSLRKIQDCIEKTAPEIIALKGTKEEKRREEKLSAVGRLPVGVASGEEVLLEFLSKRSVSASAWLWGCSKKFLIQNELWFYPGIVHEDLDWQMRMLLVAKKVYCSDIFFYRYIARPGAITQAKNQTKNVEDLLFICSRLEDVFPEDMTPELKKASNNSLVDIFLLADQLLFLSTGKGLDRETFKTLNLEGKASHPVTKMAIFLLFFAPNIYRWLRRVKRQLRS